MQDFEKLGVFYLGREYDLAAAARRDDLLLYDSKDLTTHAVCVGMTGSGKTGLCLAVLEEAALDGLPAIAIDPKGDLSNLLLTFPELRASDFRPWIDENEAARKNISPDELAEQTATQWREGLAEWGEDGARIARFRDAVDLAVYTPGSNAGLPISVLRSFDAPPSEIIGDDDLLRERVVSAASGLLALVGLKVDPIRSREHILVSQLLDTAWRQGKNLDLAALVGQIQSPPIERVGSLDLETFFPTKDRTELAMLLNNLLASPGFAGWMEGEPLDVARLLHTPQGKPRLSIMSIAHLSDAERMFFVTILLNEVLAWARSQSGTSSLRAILYMDEVFGYFPPTANPPAKTPMLTLLKQGRAYGLGIVLATQNPVDLDYKGLSNTGTWFLGRLQTERDKARVLEGLEGASAAAGSTFDRGQMEATLAALGNRVFLMNNVHDSHPVVFQTRWCLSYLRGPLTRSQIQKLMADRKAGAPPVVKPIPVKVPAAAPQSALVSQDVKQVFVVRKSGSNEHRETVYQPAIFGLAKLHFVDSKARVDCWQDVAAFAQVGDHVDNPWDQANVEPKTELELTESPAPGMTFAPVPEHFASPKNHAAWSKSLVGHLYRNHTLSLWSAPELKEYSQPNESEEDFRQRMQKIGRERLEVEVEKLRRKHSAKIAPVENQIRRTEARLDNKSSQFWWRAMQAVGSFVSTVATVLTGRMWASQRNIAGAKSTARSASRAARERGEMGRAATELEALRDKRDDLVDLGNSEVAQLDADYRDPQVIAYPVRPRERDISVEKVALAWVVQDESRS